MLVHDIRKNQTRVIDFRETAPSAIHEDMLQTNLDLTVSDFFVYPFYDSEMLSMRTENNVLCFNAVVNVCILFLLLHFSLVCWWEYQAHSVDCIRHTSSMAGMVTII